MNVNSIYGLNTHKVIQYKIYTCIHIGIRACVYAFVHTHSSTKQYTNCVRHIILLFLFNISDFLAVVVIFVAAVGPFVCLYTYILYMCIEYIERKCSINS